MKKTLLMLQNRSNISVSGPVGFHYWANILVLKELIDYFFFRLSDLASSFFSSHLDWCWDDFDKTWGNYAAWPNSLFRLLQSVFSMSLFQHGSQTGWRVWDLHWFPIACLKSYLGQICSLCLARSGHSWWMFSGVLLWCSTSANSKSQWDTFGECV